MRSKSWVIVERLGDEDERTRATFDVEYGRRTVATGLSNQGSARDVVQNHLAPGERVWFEEAADGYRTELTRSFDLSPHQKPDEEIEAFPFDPERPARSRYLARYGRSTRVGKWF